MGLGAPRTCWGGVGILSTRGREWTRGQAGDLWYPRFCRGTGRAGDKVASWPTCLLWGLGVLFWAPLPHLHPLPRASLRTGSGEGSVRVSAAAQQCPLLGHCTCPGPFNPKPENVHGGRKRFFRGRKRNRQI